MFIVEMVVTALVVMALPYCFSDIKCKNIATAAMVAIVFSLANWVVSFFLAILYFLTLGLLILIVNFGLLYLTDQLIDGFEIKSMKSTFFASLIITLVNMVFF